MLLNKTQSRLIAALALLLFFIIVGLATSAKENKLNTKTVEQFEQPLPTAVPLAESAGDAVSAFALKRFHRSETRDGKKLWEVEADSGEYAPQSKQASLFKPRMQLFKDGQPQVQIESDQAELVIDGASLNSAVIRGHVVVNYQGEISVRSELANLDRVSNTVSSDSPVTIETQGLRIEGAKMKADITTQTVNLSGGVKTILTPSERRKK